LFEKQGEELEFPDLPFRGHLTDDLESLGRIAAGPNGPVAVSQAEIQAWATNTNVTFEGLEADWLGRMSAAYADEMLRSNDTNAASPLSQ
jgi:uncharacterized protein (DUF1501 family)